MSREIVIWSGGADSTVVLHRLAKDSSALHPVVALTVESHPQLDKIQLEGQRRAQKKYLYWAWQEKGLHIKHVKVNIDSNGEVEDNTNAQALVWLVSAMPYVYSGDRVHMGYIKSDEFWHSKANFVSSFQALCQLREIKADLVFDLEWNTKLEVVRELKHREITPECIWVCDEAYMDGKDPRACGHCLKCRDLLKACTEIKEQEADVQIRKGWALALSKAEGLSL